MAKSRNYYKVDKYFDIIELITNNLDRIEFK